VVTPIRLYPLYCTLYLCTLTLTRRHLQALVALVSDIFSLQFYGVHCIGYNFVSSQSFRFRFEIYKLFLSFFLLKLARATTALNFEHICVIALILPVFLHSLDPGLNPQI
jgi:hypothetical protein